MNARMRQIIKRVVADFVAMDRNHRHDWIREWQSTHRVCSWCNACEGGCP